MRVVFVLTVFMLANAANGIAAQADDAAMRLGPALAQLRDFARGQGEKIWPGYGMAPFGFLLIGSTQETLLCRDDVPDGFVAAGRDAATGCTRYTRPRSGLPDTLLAAMPLFGPPTTIVMGTPRTTGRSAADWLRTILHEHFHQWQMNLPDYFARSEALDLKRDAADSTWMLDYPFPYEAKSPRRAYARASRALADALAARGTPRLADAFARFIRARMDFAARVSARDWRYLEYEQWFEGAARWTEIALGKIYPDAAVRDAAATLERRTLEQLRTPDMARQRRELVYPFGAGEFLLLDACDTDWRSRYTAQMSLAPLLDAALARCQTRKAGPSPAAD